MLIAAGAPLAFESTLGSPVVPERPTVTDRGEVIAAVERATGRPIKVVEAPRRPGDRNSSCHARRM